MGSCMTDKCREGFDKWWNDVGAEAYAPCEVLNYPEEQAYAMWQAGAKWQAAQDLPNKHTAEKLPTRDTDKLVGGDWNCEHGISHKQCGSCYDQTEPPYLDGLGAYVRSTDYEKLKLENAQLREILAECALDLKEEVAGRYTIEGRIHPAYQDRFDRDMQPVRKAESLLHPNKDSV